MNLRNVYRCMESLIESSNDDYSDIWVEFWKLSNRIGVHIDWYDPDTSYEEDIMARYNAIGAYLEEANNEQHN
jgi:hypothetical protein